MPWFGFCFTVHLHQASTKARPGIYPFYPGDSGAEVNFFNGLQQLGVFDGFLWQRMKNFVVGSESNDIQCLLMLLSIWFVSKMGRFSMFLYDVYGLYLVKASINLDLVTFGASLLFFSRRIVYEYCAKTMGQSFNPDDLFEYDEEVVCQYPRLGGNQNRFE